MKKIFSTMFLAALPMLLLAQGWPANYGGVMLQGFYWDSYNDSRWTRLEAQADELAEFYDLVWVPQSASCNGTSMGYDDLYWFTNYNSSFGNETQLRSMISTFKGKGLGTIADVVINHRKSLSGWLTFPRETYNGVTYQLLSTDVVANDDNGQTKTWADNNGYTLSSNNDSGEGWDGMRDLDHHSANVQTNVKAYLHFLLEDLGYAGFRYDMVKGYSPAFTGTYNADAQPEFSVGEYWDGNANTVKNWLNGTKVDNVIQSAAFDFPFRYTCRDAFNNNQWSKLSTGGVCTDASYKRYAVTFVENHDTQYRDANNPNDPITKNITAANAYMLAMPGTPCVFLTHWNTYKNNIKNMIYVRKMVGITNQSGTQAMVSTNNYHAQLTTGTAGKLMVVIGSGYTPSATQYTKVISGQYYSYYVNNDIDFPWVDKPSATYSAPFYATLTALSAQADAQLVYTTDGTEPTAASTAVTSGTKLQISQATVLKVGLLVDGAVKNVITRNYTWEEAFTPYTATVYVKDPTAAPNNWPSVNIHAWDMSGKTTNVLTDTWPGKTITDTKVINGTKFYYREFTIPDAEYTFGVVINWGTSSTASSHQTVDVTDINHDIYLEIATQTNKFEVNDITDQYSGTVVPGDVNGDGQVTIADANAVIFIILNGTDSVDAATLALADVNGDGQVTIADANAVISIILGN